MLLPYFIEIKNVSVITDRGSAPIENRLHGEHQPVIWVGYISDRAAPHDGSVQKRDIFC
jgi:hypothetical protein